MFIIWSSLLVDLMQLEVPNSLWQTGNIGQVSRFIKEKTIVSENK